MTEVCLAAHSELQRKTPSMQNNQFAKISDLTLAL